MSLAAFGVENRRLPIGIGCGDFHLAADLIEQGVGLAAEIPNPGEEVLAPAVVENQPALFLLFRLGRRRGDDGCDGVTAG